MHLGDNIFKARKLLGETQFEFASRMGVTLPMQKTYEKNKSRPDLIYLEKLVELTGIPQKQLVNAPISIDDFKISDGLKETKVTKATDDPAYLAGQLSMVERLIAKLEKENETIQVEKERLLKTLDKAQDAIIKALEPIKEYSGKILANSETIQADLEALIGKVRSDDAVILKGTDRILGREEGASSQEADNGERAFLESDKGDHTTDSSDKQDNSGKGRRQPKA